MINLARLKERVGKVEPAKSLPVFYIRDDSQLINEHLSLGQSARTDIPKLIEAIEILSAACEYYQFKEYYLSTMGETEILKDEGKTARSALELAAKKLESVK